MGRHTCKECGRSYNKNWRLEEHLRSHNGEVSMFFIHWTSFKYFVSSESQNRGVVCNCCHVLGTFWVVTALTGLREQENAVNACENLVLFITDLEPF